MIPPCRVAAACPRALTLLGQENKKQSKSVAPCQCASCTQSSPPRAMGPGCGLQISAQITTGVAKSVENDASKDSIAFESHNGRTFPSKKAQRKSGAKRPSQDLRCRRATHLWSTDDRSQEATDIRSEVLQPILNLSLHKMQNGAKRTLDISRPVLQALTEQAQLHDTQLWLVEPATGRVGSQLN